jgi:imidazolonepropionase-like amidohydrolase
MSIPRLLLALALSVSVTTAPARAQPAPTVVSVIKAARIIDGSGAPPLDAGAVVVTGDTITWVGKASDLRAPAGARVIDLGRMTLLPGLFDCHVHITGVPGDGGDTQELRETDAHKAIHGVVASKVTLDAGFTTIRDVGGSYATVALRDMIGEGLVPGPRMLVAGRSIGITGGHGDINGWSPYLSLPGTAQIADGIEGVRKAVRDQIKYGADLIKVIASGGILSVGDSPNSVQYSFEELKTIVDEAGHSGRKVAAHAHGAQSIKDSVRAGVASIEHGSFIDDEGIRMMKERGTYMVPTLYTLDFIINDGAANGTPPYAIAKARAALELQRKNLRKAYQSGVKFAYGTDAAVIPHGQNAKDFDILVNQLGVPPMDAIKIATTNAADLLGLADKTGAIRAGLWADLIAVDGDPLTDIRRLEHVAFVMKSGTVYKDVAR